MGAQDGHLDFHTALEFCVGFSAFRNALMHVLMAFFLWHCAEEEWSRQLHPGSVERGADQTSLAQSRQSLRQVPALLSVRMHIASLLFSPCGVTVGDVSKLLSVRVHLTSFLFPQCGVGCFKVLTGTYELNIMFVSSQPESVVWVVSALSSVHMNLTWFLFCHSDVWVVSSLWSVYTNLTSFLFSWCCVGCFKALTSTCALNIISVLSLWCRMFQGSYGYMCTQHHFCSLSVV